MHRAVTKFARPQVPTATGAERGLHHDTFKLYARAEQPWAWPGNPRLSCPSVKWRRRRGWPEHDRLLNLAPDPQPDASLATGT
jgi:hypothetical protein